MLYHPKSQHLTVGAQAERGAPSSQQTIMLVSARTGSNEVQAEAITQSPQDVQLLAALRSGTRKRKTDSRCSYYQSIMWL